MRRVDGRRRSPIAPEAEQTETQQTEAEQPERSLFYQTPGEPYEYLRQLREDCPVYKDPLLRGWFLTRFQDTWDVLSDAERFRLQTRPEEQYAEHQPKERVSTFRQLLNSKSMGPHVEAVLKPELDKLFKKFEGRGKVEFYEEFGNPFPAHVIGRLFGLGEDDFDDLIAYRDARSALFNAPPDAEDIAKAAAEWQDKIDARMREVLAEQRENPTDNLLRFLLDAEEEGKPIPDEEIMKIAVRDILMAGSETTARSICNAIYRLVAIPGMYEKLRDDRELVEPFVEESLRYDPPVQIFWRAPNVDAEFSGCPIKKDEQIYVSIAGANRDPERFERPDEFDITRELGKSLTFSVGPHRCPGAWVGRNETEMAVYAVLDRLPNARLDPDAPQPELTEVVLRTWRPLHLLFDPA